MKQSKASDISILSIFIAIMLIIHFLSRIIYSFWPFPIRPTLIHIPVIIGAIILGWKKGAFLGCIMGFISFLNATLAPIPTSFLFSPFVPHGNIYSLFIAFIPRILIGILPFFIFQLINNRIGASIAGLLSSAIHTVLVLGSAFIFFNAQLNMTFKALIATIVASNSIVEALAAAIICSSIIPILLRLRN